MGFDEEESDKTVQFRAKRLLIPDLPSDDPIKRVVVGQSAMMLSLSSNRILRWIFEQEKSSIHTLPSKDQSKVNFFNPLDIGMKVGGKILKTTANVFMKESKREIRKLFMDPLGYHTILTTLKGDNFYFNISQESISKIGCLKGHMITAVHFPTPDTYADSGDLVVGTKQGQLWLLRVEHPNKVKNRDFMPKFEVNMSQSNKEKGVEYVFTAKKVLDIPGNKMIGHISYLNVCGDKKVLMAIVTPMKIYMLNGSPELQYFFAKYDSPEKVMVP